MSRPQVEPFAVAACVLSVGVLVLYLSIIREQGGEPAAWAVAALVVASAGSGYGSVGAAPYRGGALVAAGAVLVLLGLVAILTIGLPMLLAGALCVVALVRQRRAPTG